MTHFIPGKQPFVNPKGLCWDLPWATGDAEIGEIAEALDKNDVSTRVLVQNASYELDCIRANYRRAQRLGATHLVLTHFDQMRNVAKIWDLLTETELVPLFFSANDSLLSTVRLDPLKQLSGRTLGVA
jgi:flagellar biosynthesis protein FlhF